MTNSITIIRPDDFHVHLRNASTDPPGSDGAILQNVAPYTAQVFGRALVMPNTLPPIRTAEEALGYERQVIEATQGYDFKPLMTLKLLKSTKAQTILDAKAAGILAGKFYPEGATTNAHDTDGCPSPLLLQEALEAMEACGMILCLHGEVPKAFSMDREALFLDRLVKLRTKYPKLRIVLEHITTKQAVACVRVLPDVAATITAHHLELTLDDIVGGNLNPHAFCKPIAKTPADREAVIAAALSGDPKFFFGSDTAPHLHKDKCSHGCAGIFSAPCALEVLAHVFHSCGWLSRLEDFVSRFGAMFYGLPVNQGTVTLTKTSWEVPKELHGVVPYRAGETLPWKVTDITYRTDNPC